jgi:hypothetical protein
MSPVSKHKPEEQISSDSLPELEPPGAGLPDDELKLTQQRFHQAFDNNPRSYYEELFDNEKHNILKLINEIDDNQLTTQVLIERFRGIEDSSRNWSAYMTLEHLHMCNVIFLDIIEKLVRGNTTSMTTVLPENLKPDPQSGRGSLPAFEQSANNFQHIVSNIDDLATELTHPHPWLGPLTAAKWLALSAAHMKIHRVQMERIKEGLLVKL